MHTIRRGAGAAATAVLAGALLIPSAATAHSAEPSPGSGKGGSPGPSVPAGYRVSTELPPQISVAVDSGRTSLTAKVVNGGSDITSALTMKVVGFDGLRIIGVAGCSRIPAGELPEGSNSAFSCTVDSLQSGRSRSFAVTAHYDLSKQGKICLPVTLGNTDTLLWQQGPVDFGTTKPLPDAPDAPLYLGTTNVPPEPSGPGATPAPSERPPQGELPDTGPASALPLAGVAAALLAVGGTGVWLTSRRTRR